MKSIKLLLLLLLLSLIIIVISLVPTHRGGDLDGEQP
jgi:hypothetical protein